MQAEYSRKGKIKCKYQKQTQIETEKDKLQGPSIDENPARSLARVLVLISSGHEFLSNLDNKNFSLIGHVFLPFST